MKKILVKTLLTSALIAFTSMAFATPPTESHVVKEAIVVPAHSTSNPIFIPVSGKLLSIKLCTSFDSPVKNVQVKGEIGNVWFGSVSQDCTSLDDVGSVDLDPESSLRLICRNFDDVQRTCRVKVVYYTKNTGNDD
jgi:hypothetical protein